MKVISVLALALLFFSVSYAEGPMEPMEASQELTGIVAFTGKINSVEKSDNGGVKINLTSFDDNIMNFDVPPGTQMIGSEGNPLGPSDLKKGQTVSVEYTILPDGGYKVMSVQGD